VAIAFNPAMSKRDWMQIEIRRQVTMAVFMFPGQGSQSRGMGSDLFDRFPELTRIVDDLLGYSIRELCVDDAQGRLNDTRFTQVALYVVGALDYRKRLDETNAQPRFVLGHSLGEYNALEAAGVVDFESGLRLVSKRGELMAEAPSGAMAAVIGLDEAAIRETLQSNDLVRIDIANLNSPNQIIISGLKEDIARGAGIFEAKSNVSFVPLRTSGAFHSRYMGAAAREFAAYLQGVKFYPPKFPIISNVEAKPYDIRRARELLVDQIICPVQWHNSINYMLEQGETEFIEFGAGKVLTKLVDDIKRHHAKNKPFAAADTKVVTQASTPSSRQDVIMETQREVDHWNNSYPVGTMITTTFDGRQHPTRSKAMILFGHRAAVYLQGYNGYFDLRDLRPV